ncbi:MAG: Si-specific NAD(P)(+) transhydrogenase [Planctomycetota bacterium]|jgi:NAD(P) transhydrogenase|nr:Si-specific NAD(P)(+) transhydrogenase [Planctomycetota bacterium]
MTDFSVDVLVIGSGPGGEGAAMKAAKSGRDVAVVERFSKVGGGCTHWGTIPSKALRHVVRTYIEFRNSPMLGCNMLDHELTFSDLLAHAGRVSDKQVALRHGFYTRNGIQLLHGHARFIDPHTVWVMQDNGGVIKVHADHVIIATGSRPARPDDIDFSHPAVRDSDTILSLEKPPRTITVYGAGVIGCEYASIFKCLGVKVQLINTRDRLLNFLDDEITDALSYHLRDSGVVVRHNEDYERVELNDNGVVLHLRSGKKIRSDVLLWAQGRIGSIRDLGLEELGITPTSRGNITVNASYQIPEHPHIYAVGDVVGFPALASAAYDQGRYAATHLVNDGVNVALAQDIPAGIYTIPEISCVGKTERELTEAKVPYEVGQAKFRDLARAQIAGVTTGMLKILFHRETQAILGIHCFGNQAAEIVHIGQAIMAQEGDANTLQYFINTTFNYPTMAEAYRVAALNGLNRLF